MELVTTLDTFFKSSPADSSALSDSQKALVTARQEFPLLAYRQEKGHLIFTLDPAKVDLKALHPSGRNTWWAWEGSVEDPAGFGPNNKPKDSPPALLSDLGTPFKLPGQKSTFYSNAAVFPGCKFTWGEALHFNSRGQYRRPANAQVVDRLLASARTMQEIRDRFGKLIFINSWYRDPATNQRIGGASQSRHMRGDAVDFRVQDIPPPAVYAALDSWWGNRGGLASSSVFTHIDMRGHRARWGYGF